jgi:methylmalonyl-CoA mutase
MTDSVLSLAGDSPAADLAAWRAEADAALKGAPFDRLVRRTLDGVERGPLFTRENLDEVGDVGAPGAAPFVRGRNGARDPYLPWQIRQTVDMPDPKAANAAILAELSGGASEIALKLDCTGTTGVAARTLSELQTLLDGVMLDLAGIHVSPSRMGPQHAALFVAALDAAGVEGQSVRGGLGLSPIGQKSLAGGGAINLTERLDRAAEAAMLVAERYPGLKTVSITALAVHDAGASEAQEIAFALAGGASYMRAFIDRGLSAEAAAKSLEFNLAADADIHLTLAKLRAVRRGWARVLEAFGVAENERAMALHVTTSGRMLTARDPWTNLIRNACAGLGAAAGGADAITVRPFTDALGPAKPFARRLARNLQVMLMEESHLGKVADPAGGGFLHETLGARLAEAGWRVFQDIEARGGLFEAVKAGWLQDQIAKMRNAREAAYDAGKEALIGVSQYPELDARLVEVETRSYTAPKLNAPVIEPQPFADKVAAAAHGAQVRELDLPEPEWTPIAPSRIAAPFEALRDAADAFKRRSGTAPKAFLATLGGLADFNARAGFAINRLAVAGVVADPARACDSLEACAEAFAASGAKLAVICGTDEAYGDGAEALAAALKAEGAVQVWLAGKADIPGIDHAIHMRSRILEDGALAHKVTGVAP